MGSVGCHYVGVMLFFDEKKKLVVDFFFSSLFLCAKQHRRKTASTETCIDGKCTDKTEILRKTLHRRNLNECILKSMPTCNNM